MRAMPFDLSGPDFRADPYPFLRRLRETDPVFLSPLRVWLLTAYADGLATLGDPRFGHPDYKAYKAAVLPQRQNLPVDVLRSNMMICKNPPDHTRLRGVVTDFLTPSLVDGLRPRIEAIVGQLLDRVQATGRMDVIADLAYPLPITVIGEVVGMPADVADRSRGLARELFGAFDVITTKATIRLANAAGQQLFQDFRRLIDERRRRPANDMISALIHAQERENRLNDEELLANCALLFIAGHETTVGLIGNGLLALLRHPGEFRKLRDDPTLIGSAVEELLRYDSPIQFAGRIAREDVPIGGKVIRKGQTAYVLIGAANRDPAQFPEPDRLDITRKDNRHLAFGTGMHACVAGRLARLEAQIAITALLNRMPDARVASDQLDWWPGFSARGLRSLPLAF
jgi:cytochrome P450